MSVFIVIPTYNERDNIREILPRIFQQVPQASVVISDDQSPDGTGAQVEELKPDYHGQLHCLHRTGSKGYGPACLEGIQFALSQGAQKIIGMDCDLSHPPEAIPGLLALSERFDMVLGSRYTQGGSTPDWPFFRRWLSRSANFYARSLLQLPIRDMTTGFRCFNARVFEKIDFSAINCVGYGFLTELVFRVHSAGFTIGEYPIEYRDRTMGQSKMGMHIAWEGAVNVLKMRLKSKKGKSVLPDPQGQHREAI